MSNYVRNLTDAEDISQIGGKASSLAKLLRHGLTVPPGFVVSVAAYREFHDNSQPNADFWRSVLEAFDRLGYDHVAVRSSAVSEDSDSASWAGQFETYLNVTRQDLQERIVACWQSASTKRVDTYAAMQQGKPDVSVAVVVQAMVQPETAGVIFTANPIEPAANEIVIEAVKGLGEALVSGLATPDTYQIDKSTGKVNAHYTQEDAALLRDDQLSQLRSLSNTIEALYDRPMDIEWAIADDRLYVLQARPITTLP